MKFWRAAVGLVLAVLTTLSVCGPVTHLRGVAQGATGNQDHAEHTWKKGIKYLNADRTPFLRIKAETEVEKVSHYEYRVAERDHPNRWTRVNNGAGYASGSTSIVVDEVLCCRIGDIILVPRTGEKIEVTNFTPSTNTLTVTRGALGTTAAALVDNDWFKILFTAEEENGTQTTIITTDTTTVTNFTQIFKCAWGSSNTRIASSYRDDPFSLEQQRKQNEEFMKESMENAFLWGNKREELQSNGEYRRFTGGIDEFAQTNRIDMEGGIGYGDIPYLMSVFSRFGSKKKLWFCGRDAMQQIDNIGLEFRRVDGALATMGFKVKGFSTSAGDAVFIQHWGLDNGLAGHVIVVDPDHASVAQLRAFKTEMNIQTPGRDGVEHQKVGEFGMWMDTERAHGVLYNITRKLI